jgi:hypothetical protein
MPTIGNWYKNIEKKKGRENLVGNIVENREKM